jgi:hypothetical protein
MTMPQGSTEEPTVIETMTQSIPVHVVSSDAKPGKTLAAEFGRPRTILVTNTVGAVSVTPGAQRLINRNLRRRRCHIIVNATVVAQPSIDGVMIGSREEINSGVPMVPGNVAGYLQIGDNLRYEAQPELWVAYPSTNTSPVYVTVIDEIYASDPEAYKESDDR